MGRGCPRLGQARRLPYVVRRLLGWFDKHARDLPWRRTRDPYAIWVSEIMLQQTQVKTVLPYWERWMRELPSIQTLAAASPARLLKLWEGLGYYHRVRNLQKAAQIIVARHDGVFPERFEDVLALPGIGRYTAGAICSIAFNQPRAILDGNVIRVLTRLYGLRKNPREKSTQEELWRLAGQLVQEAAAAGQENVGRKTGVAESDIRLVADTAFAGLVVSGRGAARPHPSEINFGQRDIPSGIAAPRNSCSLLNQALMELGALVCTPRQPECGACPLRPECVAYEKDLMDALPNLGERRRQTQRRFAAFIVRNRGRFLVRQRPNGVVNAGLWEFPNAELLDSKRDLAETARATLKVTPASLALLGRVKHSITRFRMTLEVFRVEARARPARQQERERWLTLSEMQALAFASAHRKIFDWLSV